MSLADKVRKVLHSKPKTQTSNVRAVIEVWRIELSEQGLKIPTDVLLGMYHFCSNPDGILRAKRKALNSTEWTDTWD